MNDGVPFYRIHDVVQVVTEEPIMSRTVRALAGTIHAKMYCDNVYFVIDTAHDEAFVHWQAESAIFLPYYLELQRAYPSIKLYLSHVRNFKLLTLQQYGITREQISSTLHIPNICFIAPGIGLADKQAQLSWWKPLVAKHFLHLRGCTEMVKDRIPVLVMPRQSKENYGPNDRKIPYDQVMNWAVGLGGSVLHTDTIHNICEQIGTVRAARIIILTSGSALYVNGNFASNATIIAVGHARQHPQYPALKYVYDEIFAHGNQVHFVDQASVSEIVRILDQNNVKVHA